MASKNPFGQLQVRRDEEDEQTVQRPTGAQIPTSTPLFSQPAAAEKKKKKVRPDEKKKSEEVREENDEEGFSVVGKKKSPLPDIEIMKKPPLKRRLNNSILKIRELLMRETAKFLEERDNSIDILELEEARKLLRMELEENSPGEPTLRTLPRKEMKNTAMMMMVRI